MSDIDLRQGDCLELMKSIPDCSIDAIITDPPYGTTACKWDSVIPFEPMWAELKRIIKPNGAIVLFGSQPFTSALIMSNHKMFRHSWVWNKLLSGNPFTVKYQPLKIHEDVLVFSKKGLNYNPIMTKGKMRNKGGGKAGELFGDIERTKSRNDLYYPKSVIEFTNHSRKGKLHPTQKPVALLEYLIKTYTNEGETVLDFTMGSGSTGVACKNTNRNFIGIELDETCFNVAKERIMNYDTYRTR